MDEHYIEEEREKENLSKPAPCCVLPAKGAKGVVFEWKNITFKVYLGYGIGRFRFRRKTKVILDNLSGMMIPGKMLAIMGPS